MNNIGVMQKVNSAGYLIDNVLLMSELQVLVGSILSNQSVQIDVHMLEHQINVFIVACADDVFQNDDIGAFELF